MLEIFQYEFMRKAFLVGVLLAIIIPLIGVVVVLKRLSMMGDALSHTSLAGVALGLLLGINPIVAAVVVCMFAALSIEAIRKALPKYAEISISIIMSVGIGLASILSGFVTDGAAFDSFLFGSIVAITDTEVILVIIVTIIVVAAFLLLYKAGKSFYGFETGVFATRWVGGDRSFEEMPKNQHLMENEGFRKSSENPYRPIYALYKLT